MQKRRIITLVLVALCGMAQATFVTIGNAGNAADTTGYGAVGYSYQFSATEVTIAQMAAAKAADGRVCESDEDYWNNGSGRTVGANAPASYVFLYEAMKYCNWLTTGDAYRGAYQFESSIVLTNVMSRAQVLATGTFYYLLPTADEWYKAAYFKPDASGYSLYANGTDTIPIHGTTSGWNYYKDGYANSSPNLTWAVGYGGVEQNGTYDMMGNLEEWIEGGGVVGGSYGASKELLRSSAYLPETLGSPLLEDASVGFRVVAIPEPATAISLVLGGLIITGYRRLRKSYGHF